MAITVKDLIDQLRGYNPDAQVYFEELTFYRVKSRGPDLVQIEFSEPLVSWDPKNHTVTFQKHSA